MKIGPIGVCVFLSTISCLSVQTVPAAAAQAVPVHPTANTGSVKISEITWSGNTSTPLGISYESYVLRADGTAHRIHNVDFPRERRYNQYIGRITAPAFNNLALLLTQNGFSEMSDQYRIPYPVGFATTSAVIDGKEKTVARWDIQDAFTVGPPGLWAIESSIRRVANSIKWHKDRLAEKSGICGIVVRSKRSGAKINKPEPCAGATVTASAPSVVLAMMDTTIDGRFRLRVPPGTYMLEAMISKPGRALPNRSEAKTVIVQPGKFAQVLLELPSD